MNHAVIENPCDSSNEEKVYFGELYGKGSVFIRRHRVINDSSTKMKKKRLKKVFELIET